ncbi:MAG: FAD-binding oxidoreductase, partial [Pseudomonadota bacterium]
MATAPGFSGSSGQPEASYDLAVVGAGFTGLSAARALAKAGLKVAVFERGAVGDGASGRNGGHLSNGLAHSYASVVRDMGADTARSLYHAFDRSLDLI